MTKRRTGGVGAGTRDGGEGRLSDAEILTRLGDLLRAVPDATPDTVELQGDPKKGPDIKAAIEAHWRCGQPPFSIEVEVAPGCRMSGLDPESIGGARFKAAVAAFVEHVRLRNPKTKVHRKARVRWPAALFLRARVSPRRLAILAFYSTHKPTLQRLVAQHGVGRGWQQSYQHVWRQNNGNGMVVDLKGARAWHHTHTFQAGVVGSFLRDEHPEGELDGLEAALLCDYCCALCRADALGMVDALLAKVRPAEDDATKLKPRAKPDKRPLPTPQVADIRGGEAYVVKSEKLQRLMKLKSRSAMWGRVDRAGAKRVFRGYRAYGVSIDDARRRLDLDA